MDETQAYRVLGVALASSPEEIKAAYRVQVKQWHPDLFQNNPDLLPQAEATLKEVNDAYRLIRAAPLRAIERPRAQRPVKARRQPHPTGPSRSRTSSEWTALAERFCASGNDHEAVRAYHESLRAAQRERRPTATIWNNLGTIYSRHGHHAEAAKCYRHAILRQPNLATAWYNLGITAARLGQRNILRRTYLRLRTLDPVKAFHLAQAVG